MAWESRRPIEQKERAFEPSRCRSELPGLASDVEHRFAASEQGSPFEEKRWALAIVSQLVTILALDPEVGSRQQADKLIASFRGDAAKLAHACLVAARDLKQTVGESGRPQAEWHDEFAALLLEVAETAGVEPRLSKDRISGARVGWLLDAAQALEAFLDPQMRSPSTEACGKRLERSKTRLKQRHRQNPSSA